VHRSLAVPKGLHHRSTADASRAVAETRNRSDDAPEEDIRRDVPEDKADLGNETPVDTWPSVVVKLAPQRLRMTRALLITLPQMSLGTLRNWKQNRSTMDPAQRALPRALPWARRALRDAALRPTLMPSVAVRPPTGPHMAPATSRSSQTKGLAVRYTTVVAFDSGKD
jgi:hypothetical protein